MNNLGNSRLRSFRFEKSQKNEFFWGILPKTCFLSADTYSDYGVLPIAEGVEFLPFFGRGRRKNNDILGIYFVRNNCVFSDALELVQNKIPKKITFLGNFPGCIFHHVSFSWLCFYTVLSGWSTTSAVFRVRQYGAFWLKRSHCGDGYHISPPTGLNLESAEISTTKLANPKQQMSKSIQQFLKSTLILSPLVRWKWPTQVGTLGTLWWGRELGMM